MGAPPKEAMFGAFPEDSRLCVARCLRQYEEATAQYRKTGVDTSVFKAHSVRGASSTAASEKGVLIEDILRTAF